MVTFILYINGVRQSFSIGYTTSFIYIIYTILSGFTTEWVLQYNITFTCNFHEKD